MLNLLYSLSIKKFNDVDVERIVEILNDRVVLENNGEYLDIKYKPKKSQLIALKYLVGAIEVKKVNLQNGDVQTICK